MNEDEITKLKKLISDIQVEIKSLKNDVKILKKQKADLNSDSQSENESEENSSKSNESKENNENKENIEKNNNNEINEKNKENLKDTKKEDELSLLSKEFSNYKIKIEHIEDYIYTLKLLQMQKDILKYHDFIANNKNNKNYFSKIDLTEVFCRFKKNDLSEVEIKKVETPSYFYYGEVLNETNISHGRGICFLKSNNQLVKGQFNQNSISGNVVCIYNNEDYYNGEILNNKKEGKGFYYYKKEDKKYYGDWKNDIREGNGYEINNNGKYEGEWKYNNFEGKGKFNWLNGDVYEGEWKNGELNGKGIYWSNNGEKYEGEFKDNVKNGKGIFYYADGDQAKGEWVNNKPHGIIKFYYHSLNCWVDLKYSYGKKIK